jgi:hypothetical protein
MQQSFDELHVHAYIVRILPVWLDAGQMQNRLAGQGEPYIAAQPGFRFLTFPPP